MSTLAGLLFAVISTAEVAAVETSNTTKPFERGPFYFGFGFGMGASSVADEAKGGVLAGTLALRLGGAIDNRILIGPEILLLGQYNTWAANEVAGATLSSIMLEGMWYPLAQLPLSTSVGVGWGSGFKVNRISDSSGEDPRVVTASADGVSWKAAVGWDLLPGKGTNLGVQARYDGVYTSAFGLDHTGLLQLWVLFY